MWKEATTHSPHLKTGSSLYFLEDEESTQIIWNSSAWRLVYSRPLIYLFKHLYQYVLMNIYFILWVTI